MRLILNENGKPTSFIRLTEIIRNEMNGKSDILFYGYNRKTWIRVPKDAADYLMNCFLINKELRVEESCFNEWRNAWKTEYERKDK